jgi:hypothetical protein
MSRQKRIKELQGWRPVSYIKMHAYFYPIMFTHETQRGLQRLESLDPTPETHGAGVEIRARDAASSIPQLPPAQAAGPQARGRRGSDRSPQTRTSRLCHFHDNRRRQQIPGRAPGASIPTPSPASYSRRAARARSDPAQLTWRALARGAGCSAVPCPSGPRARAPPQQFRRPVVKSGLAGGAGPPA